MMARWRKPRPRMALRSSIKNRALNKYQAQGVYVDDLYFASKSEAHRYRQLKLMVRGGAIAGFERQVKYCLGCSENVYVVDFVVTDTDGKQWAEDVKGFETRKFRHDKKLWRSYGPMPLHVLRRQRGGAWDTEIIDGGAA